MQGERLPDPAIRFSVVIPAYNSEKTIRRAIASCLKQTHPPVEIIVADDASTDNTAAIVQSLAPQVILLSLPFNRGPSFARNRGWAQATGDYIAFLDADDSWHPQRLELAGRILSSNPEIRFLFNAHTTDPLPESYPSGPERVTPLSFARLLLRNHIGNPSCVILLRNTGLRFEESMRYMEDFDAWLRLAAEYQPFRINLKLTRTGRAALAPGGLSSNRWKMRLGECKTYIRLAKRQPLYLPLVPVLLVYSMLKHLLSLMRSRL